MTAIYLGVQTRLHHRIWVIVSVRCSRNCEKSCPELKKYNYKCYWHRVTRLEEALIKRTGAIALKFENNTKRVTKVLLMNHTARLRITATVDIYVYFYGSDRRPLLICIGGCAYAPRSKDDYCKCWCKVAEVKPDSCVCGCPGSGTRADCTEHDALLKALTTTVGFLNTVNLYQHPNGTSTGAGTGDQACTTQPGSPATTCQAGQDATTTGSTCTYAVHTFQSKPIQVQVECCPVKANGSNCYKKLTHKPIGTNGPGTKTVNNGFRLGNVEYCRNGTGGKRQGKIDYYQNGTDSGTSNTATNKYAPLQSVTAYFYNQDTKYCDPLLLVLHFKNGVANGNNNKECYRLNSSNGNSLTWEKDTEACKKEGDQLAKHLDQIRYCLKLVVRIHLEFNGTNGQSYQLMGRSGGTSEGTFDTPINGQPINGTEKQVTVTVCDVACPKLADSNYKCVKHNLTQALKDHQHQVAGLAFTLPCDKSGGAGQSACCVNGSTGQNGFVEIPVCVAGQGEAKCGEGAQAGCPTEQGQGAGTCQPGKPGSVTIPPILYNSCMGDVCVYFYACKNGGSEACGVSTDATGSGSCSTADVKTDTVPLMVKFNGNFYKPCDRDNYFTKWVCVSALAGLTGKSGCKCCCCGANADCGTDCATTHVTGCTDQCKDGCPCCSQLVEALNKVNAALNRIDLDPGKASGHGYGLPEKDGCQGAVPIRGCKLDDSVGNVRVCLTKQDPHDSDASKAYVRVIHRTKNGFRIGCITYCGQDITTGGITPNGQNGAGTKIEIANGSSQKHTEQVSTCGWNTVAAYYSCSDKSKRLPQLIVILKTDQVKNGGTVTGSKDSGYGYYVLATKNGGSGDSGYQYRWVNVNGKEKPTTGVKLDEKTDFSLLNAAIILLEQRVTGTSGNCTYGEQQIGPAVASAIEQKSLVKSPGNKDDVNRLTGKSITVTDETTSTSGGAGAGTCTSSGDGTSSGVCCCKCLTDTGFKVMTHCLDQLVKLNGTLQDKLCNISLITGLKFVIPTRNGCGNYRQVTLKDNSGNGGGSSDTGYIKYHQPTNGNKVCVYFYGCDPRPLLVCYNGWAYAPKTKEDYDKQEWTKVTDFEECSCTKPSADKCENCKLLTELICVSDFLNRVMIHIVPMPKYNCRFYYVHEFNGCVIRLKVTSKLASDSFCFNRFTHTHAGTTGRNGSGFRLGNIHYGSGTVKNGVANGSCIKLNGDGANNGGNGKCINSVIEKKGESTGKPCETASHVVVFYYKKDPEHKNPIVVAMCTGECNKLECKLYYILKDRGQKKYARMTNALELNDEKKLDAALNSALFTSAKNCGSCWPKDPNRPSTRPQRGTQRTWRL